MPNQAALDRLDLSPRVFNLKRKEFTDDLTRKHVLGRVLGHVHTMKFQK